MSEEKFFRIKADSELDYDGCYYEGDSPSVEQKLSVEQYDDPEMLLKAVLQEGYSGRYDQLLEELGYIKKTKLDKTQKLGLEAKYAMIRYNTKDSYSSKFKFVDIDDSLFASQFSCYDLGEVFELYQKVRMSDLKKAHPVAYAEYQKMKKKVAADKVKRKAAAIKAAATRKRKEIAKAKKVLEEAGEDA